MYTKHTVRISLLILAMKGWRMNTCRWYFVHWLIWGFTSEPFIFIYLNVFISHALAVINWLVDIFII